MIKKILLITSLILLTILYGCEKEKISDATRFAEEYTEVSEYNYFVYRSGEEIVKIF